MKSLKETILEKLKLADVKQNIPVIIKNIPYILGFDEDNIDKEDKEIVEKIAEWITSNNILSIDYITSKDVAKNMDKNIKKLYSLSNKDYNKCYNEVKNGKELLSIGDGLNKVVITATNNVLELNMYDNTIYIATTDFLVK